MSPPKIVKMVDGVEVTEYYGKQHAKHTRVVNLKELGFQYRVSDEALAKIRASEARAAKVLTTAHKYLFR